MLMMGLLWMPGCGEKSTDTAQTTDVNPVVVDNPCEGIAEAETFEVLYEGRAGLDAPIGTAGLTIDSQEAWDVFVEGFYFGAEGDAFSRDVFDWTVEKVAVASIFVGSTCSLSLLETSACSVDGNSVVHVHAEDSSGSCEVVCDAEGQQVYIVVVPADSDPEYSLHLSSECE